MMRKVLGSSRGEKARFEISVASDASQTFATELKERDLTKSLRDALLIPFIEQVNVGRGSRLACVCPRSRTTLVTLVPPCAHTDTGPLGRIIA